MAIHKSITELVGKTPLVQMNSLSKKTGAEIIGKVESFNPMSSVKDRIALAMIDRAESEGLLKKGSSLVEPTSGNTGIGLAFVAAARGYALTLTMPDTMSVERIKLLKALGATVVLTPGSGGMKRAIDEAARIAEEEGAFVPSQFENPANPAVHEATTAQEILRDTGGKLDFFVAGAGTGGTISGCSRRLKREVPSVTTVAVEPAESPVISGGKPGPHRIQGIGAGFIPENLEVSLIDRIETIASDEAGEMARQVAWEEGILIGISGGAALAAAVRIAQEPGNKGKRLVVILPDSGERYLSTWLYNES